MLPLVLITGFLGSGKTTLLRLLVEQARSRRCACIVNEFSSVDIDGQLVDLPPGQLVSIPGGSIFCRCLAGEFIRVLNEVSGRTDGPAPEIVFIEASGIADPTVISQMLVETRLNESYHPQRVVTVVDPGSFQALIHTLPSIIAQVQASDLILVNKTDLYDCVQIDRCEEQIREFNPSARIIRTQYCRAEFDWCATALDADRSHHRVGEYALCKDPNFTARALHFDKPLDGETLLGALQALHPHIYRAKGFVSTKAGRMYVDVSIAGVNCTPAVSVPHRAARAEGCDLVIIAAPAAQPQVDAFALALGSDPGLAVLP